MTRDSFLQVRCTREEKELWRLGAWKAGKEPHEFSSWVRRCLTRNAEMWVEGPAEGRKGEPDG